MSTATLANNVDTAASKPDRVPKLAVRNKTLDGDDATPRPPTAATVATQGSGDTNGQASSESPSLRAPSPGSGRRVSDQSGSRSSGQISRDGRDRPSTVVKSVEGSKKKKGMLGFLTMKEPSATALEAFAEAERRRAQHKGSSVNVSGVSSRKLPEHVPKVNSKWDGLPENAKRPSVEARSVRSRGDSVATSGRRPSTHSSWSKSSDENKRSFGSLSSRPPQSPQFVQRSRGTVCSTHSARAPMVSDKVHPAMRPIAVEETPENLPQTFLYPPSPPREKQRPSPPRQSLRAQSFVQELPATFGPVPQLDCPDGPLPELESEFAVLEMDAQRGRTTTPVQKSPITPSVDDAYASNYYADGIANAYNGHGDPGTFFHSQSDTDHEDFARSSAPKQLRQPINFSRRRTGKARPPSLGHLPEAPTSGFTFLHEEPPILSPTLKGSDGRIDPFLTDTFAAHSRATGKIVELPAEAVAPHKSPAKEVPTPESVHASKSALGSSHSEILSGAAGPRRPWTAPPIQEEEYPEGPEDYYTSQLRRKSDESTAPSVAPSTMSAQWKMTPKERLGLGGKIRKGEVLPWETAEDLRDNAEVVAVAGPGGRSSAHRGGGLPSPTGTMDSKLKRLSYRWGGKR